jgi:hypothetical protein
MRYSAVGSSDGSGAGGRVGPESHPKRADAISTKPVRRRARFAVEPHNGEKIVTARPRGWHQGSNIKSVARPNYILNPPPPHPRIGHRIASRARWRARGQFRGTSATSPIGRTWFAKALLYIESAEEGRRYGACARSLGSMMILGRRWSGKMRAWRIGEIPPLLQPSALARWVPGTAGAISPNSVRRPRR